MKLFKKLNKGFTLVELVVVIAVIAILSAVSIAAYTGITKNAREKSAQSEARQIVTVLKANILAHADGYESKVTVGGNEVTYLVRLDGKKLDFKAWDPDEGEEGDWVAAESTAFDAIIADMLEEAGEHGLSGTYSVDESGQGKITCTVSNETGSALF